MDSFHIMPIGSIYAREEMASAGYLDIVQNLPPSIKGIISSVNTSSYIKGLSRTYDIPEEKQPSIAFAILELAIGKKKFDQMPGILSNELGLSSDQTQKMSSEIERDIFGPVKKELDEFLSGQKGTRSTPSSSPSYEGEKSRATPIARPSSLPNNLLDLKEIAAAKRQEQLDAKPTQKQLPKRQVTARIAPPQQPRAPLPPPLTPPRAGGETPNPAPKFPLPPRTQTPSPLTPPKPAVSPLDFSKY